MSEKLDGIRAYWNGEALISRNGININYPVWFVEQLPYDVALDGELWTGRGTLEMLISTLNSGDTAGWVLIKMIVFDVPGSKDSYEMRMRYLSALKLPNQIQIVDLSRCKSSQHAEKCLLNIINNGGEGLIMNKPNSVYSSTRVESVLKVKVDY